MENLLQNLKTSALQLYAKLKDLYMSMTLGNRIVATLLATTLLFSLGYLIVGSIKSADPLGNTIMLFDGHLFDRNDQLAAYTAIANANLKGHQWIGGRLQVPIDKQANYIAALAAANVPSNIPGKNSSARLEGVDKLNPWQNARMMDTKMIAYKEIDCANAIKKFPGIADAEVFSNKRPDWNRNVWARMQTVSVGVMVTAIDNKALSIETITAIGGVIVPMFGIINPSKEIRIVDKKHSRTYDGLGEEVGSAQGEYLRHQAKYEKQWNNRISDLLSEIDGLRVDTNVVLTQYKSQETFDVTHRKPTQLVNHEFDYHFHREGYDRFGRPGHIAQFNSPLIDPTASINPKDITDEKKREQESTNALPGTETKEEALPYIPKEVTASIGVPIEHVLKIWQQKNRLTGGAPDATPTEAMLLAEQEELTLSIKRRIAKLLETYRLSNKSDPMELVVVDYVTIPQDEVPELTAWELFVLFIQQHWQTLGLMSLAFSGIGTLYLISRPQKPDHIVIYEGMETPLDAIDARLEEKYRREEEARRAAEVAALEAKQAEFENSLGELAGLRTLRDEVAEVIAKNPDAAAAVIRQWIGNAVLVEAKS